LLLQPLVQRGDSEEARAEFEELARSAGAEVLGTVTARVGTPNPRYFVGSGKADELKSERERLGTDLLLVNHALSPVQERNLEKHLGCRVVDRTGLILDIFAQRARSHEGKLQVELAQLKHLSTRLVRGWTHLERQRGGSIGLRGPGETQLEIDRRLVAHRMKVLEDRLAKVEGQREQARRARKRAAVPVVAVVGYTNAGKSTLFNALTRADVYAADQLFATLDPTVRRLDGLASGPAVLADTVGFVRDLPHDLVAAFRSTLSEARDADLLLHVIDAHDPHREDRISQVNAVLDEIDAASIPQIEVWNKIDLVEGGEPRIERIDGGRRIRVHASARDGRGLDLVRDAIGDVLSGARVSGRVLLPHSAGRLRARLFELGVVAAESADDQGWTLDIDAPAQLLAPLLGGTDPEAGRLRDALVLNDPDA
jgi:GTP-binding protein HflX